MVRTKGVSAFVRGPVDVGKKDHCVCPTSLRVGPSLCTESGKETI